MSSPAPHGSFAGKGRYRRAASAGANKKVDRQLRRAAAMVEALEQRWMLSAVDPFATKGTPIPTTATATVFATTLADINGDGIPDLIAAYNNGTVSIFLGNTDGQRGTGEFSFVGNLSGISDGLGAGAGTSDSLAVGKLFNGEPDIVVAAGGTQFAVLQGNGQGSFGTASLYSVNSGNVNSITVGNLNKDQFGDIAIGDTVGKIDVFFSTAGAIVQSTSGPYSVGGATDNIDAAFIADVNGDGNPDIIYLDKTTQTVGILSSLPSTVTTTAADNTNVIAFAVGDLGIKGGTTDLVTIEASSGGTNRVSVLYNQYANGNAFVHYQSYNLPSTTGTSVVPSLSGASVQNLIGLHLGDINGDGLQDVIISQYYSGGTSKLTTFASSSTGLVTATPYVTPLAGSATSYVTGLAVGDTNGDGNADAVFTYQSTTSPYNSFVPSVNAVQTAPSFYSTASATFLYGQSNEFTVETHGDPSAVFPVPSGLPTGVTLNGGLNDGVAIIGGTPTQSGVFHFNIKAENNGGTATQAFTLTVNAPPIISSADTATFIVGTVGTFAITADTGFPVDATTTITSGTLPSGLTLTNNGDGTAKITGTPALGTQGDYTLDLSASNGISPAGTQTLTLDVDAPPAFTSPSSTSFAVGLDHSFTITATNGFSLSAETVTEMGALPSGLTFTDNGDGTATISGTPDTGTSGVYTLDLTADNGVSPAGTQTFMLNVGIPPAINSGSTATFTVGAANTFNITTIVGTPAGETITKTGALPTGLTFTDNGDGTAKITGTAASGTQGAYTLDLTASNGILPNGTRTLTLDVDAPAAFTSASTSKFSVGFASSFTITATNGFSTSAETVTEMGSLPSGLTFTDNGDGTATISGTPDTGTSGPYTLNLTADNGVSPAGTQTLTVTVGVPPTINSGATTSFIVGTSNTFSITTVVGIPSGETITETGALPAGLTFTDNGNGTATIFGTAASGSQGAYMLDLTASNHFLPNGTQTLTLDVGAPPTFTSASSTSFAVGLARSFTITATNGFSLSAETVTEMGALPSGLTFTDNGDGTATISGTPDTGTSGVYTLDLTAANGISPAGTQTLTLNVGIPPSFNSGATATFKVNRANTFNITTIAGIPAGETITETGALPTGLTFTDNGDGTATISGTPAPGTQKAYTLDLTASNGILPNGTQTLTLDVDAPPSFTNPATSKFAVGVTNTFTITATNGFSAGSETVTEMGSLPSGLTFTDNGNGTATITGTPAMGSSGLYTLDLTADNGVTPAGTQTLMLTVGLPPTFTNATTATFVVGTANTFNITANNGFPTSGETITETGALPTGLTLVDNGDGTASISGTPAAGTAGAYTLDLTANNSISPNGTQTLTLDVDQAPTFTSAASAGFAVGTAKTFTITATNGFSASAETIVELGALPTGLTFTDNGNGTATISGTAASGQNGLFTLTLTADNGTPTAATQTFVVTVGVAPTFSTGAAATFAVGAANTFDIRANNGSPTAGETITETGALPSGLTFTDDGNGNAEITGTPATGTGGMYTLNLTANNGLTPNGTQTLVVTVNGAPAFTSAAAVSFPVGVNSSFTVSTTSFPTAALTQTGLPSGLSFVDNGNGTATISGTPTSKMAGVFSIVLSANNTNTTSHQTLTLTIAAIKAPAIKSANSAMFQVGQAGSFTFTTAGFPAPTLSEIGALPSGVSFVDHGNGTASLTGTPTSGTARSYALVVFAHNGFGTDALQTFSLQVNQALAFTSSAAHTFTAGTAATFTIAVSGVPTGKLALSGALPSGLKFHDNGDGTAFISGTAAASAAGVHTVTITASNANQKITQQLALTVNVPPTFTSAAAATFMVGSSGTFNITANNGMPTAGETITKTGSLPTGLTFTDNGHGTAKITGTPGAGTGGVYTLNLTANNGVSPNGTQTLTVTVNAPPAITSPSTDTFIVGTAGTFTVTAGGFPIAKITAGGLPKGLTFHDNGNGTATISGTPAANTGGAYTVNIAAANSVQRVTQTFTLKVDQAPSLKGVTLAPTVNVKENKAVNVTYTVAGFPTPVTLSNVANLPAGMHLVLNGTSLLLSGTPTVMGVFNVTFTLTNNSGAGGTSNPVNFGLTLDISP